MVTATEQGIEEGRFWNLSDLVGVLLQQGHREITHQEPRNWRSNLLWSALPYIKEISIRSHLVER
jgi:hypothetical protein